MAEKGQSTSIAQIAFAIVAGLAVYGFVDMAKNAEIRHACDPIVQLRPRYMGADRSAPDFDLDDGKGGRVKLSSFRGKVVILHFWTRTCGPCREELPNLAKFAELIKDRKDVALVTVTIDDGPKETTPLFDAIFGKGKPPPFIVGYDPESSIVKGKYGTSLFPETWLIDPEGRIRARFDGIPHAGDSCDEMWNGPLILSAIDSLRSPLVCDVTIDPKVDPRPDRLIAPCRAGGEGM
jgi:thiol-disulfide isomerase/thioredoxin